MWHVALKDIAGESLVNVFALSCHGCCILLMQVLPRTGCICCRGSRARKAEHSHRAVELKKAWLIDAPVSLRQDDEWIKAFITASLQVGIPACSAFKDWDLVPYLQDT